jgi:hypothetical protein
VQMALCSGTICAARLVHWFLPRWLQIGNSWRTTEVMGAAQHSAGRNCPAVTAGPPPPRSLVCLVPSAWLQGFLSCPASTLFSSGSSISLSLKGIFSLISCLSGVCSQRLCFCLTFVFRFVFSSVPCRTSVPFGIASSKLWTTMSGLLALLAPKQAGTTSTVSYITRTFTCTAGQC